MTAAAPCGCLAAKFDSCNGQLSSVHTLLVNILRCVRLYIKRKYKNTIQDRPVTTDQHLFYSILFYSILFYSILFYSILFYSIHIFLYHLSGSALDKPSYRHTLYMDVVRKGFEGIAFQGIFH